MPRKSIRKNLRKFRSKRRILKSKKSSRTRKSIKNKRLSRRKHKGGTLLEQNTDFDLSMFETKHDKILNKLKNCLGDNGNLINHINKNNKNIKKKILEELKANLENKNKVSTPEELNVAQKKIDKSCILGFQNN